MSGNIYSELFRGLHCRDRQRSPFPFSLTKNNESHFKVFRRMTWFTLFWIPIFPVGRKIFVTCPICNYGKKMKKAEAMDLLEKYNNSVLTDQQEQQG